MSNKPPGAPTTADHTDRCSIKGCEREVLARGLCRPHYDRARKDRDLSEPIREYGTGGKVQLATPKVPQYVAEWYSAEAKRLRTTVYAYVNAMLIEHAEKQLAARPKK